MENKLATIGKFRNELEAIELVEFLKENNIPAATENNSVSFDPTFSFNESDREIVVKINEKDFERATELIQSQEMNEIPTDHYLFEFSDDELIEVIQKPDEWSNYDVNLASSILNKRGKGIDPQKMRAYREERSKVLEEPYRANPILIVVGFIFAIASGILALSFGGILPNIFILLGITIGFSIVAFKKQNPLTGKTDHYFSKTDRNRGWLIIIVEVISLVIAFCKFFIG